MTKQEQSILEVVANNVEWLKRNQGDVLSRLDRINGSLSKNWAQTEVNKADIASLGKSIAKQWAIIAGGFALISGAITLILKAFGVW